MGLVADVMKESNSLDATTMIESASLNTGNIVESASLNAFSESQEMGADLCLRPPEIASPGIEADCFSTELDGKWPTPRKSMLQKVEAGPRSCQVEVQLVRSITQLFQFFETVR